LSVTPGLKPTSTSQSKGGGGRRPAVEREVTGSVSAGAQAANFARLQRGINFQYVAGGATAQGQVQEVAGAGHHALGAGIAHPAFQPDFNASGHVESLSADTDLG
jgi:hypothetical protein